MTKTHLANKTTKWTLDTPTPPTILCDAYKTSHNAMYPKGTTKIYSTFTPRSNKYMPMANGAVVFGVQMFVKKYLLDYFNTYFFNRDKSEVLAEYERYMEFYLGVANPDSTHFAKLHDLGYLPVEIRALDEGTVVPIQVPFFTIENTHPEFAWVTNFLETIISNEMWMPITSATYSYELRKMINEFALTTTGSTDNTDFQLHDFSMRGMSSLESATASGMGHLLSSWGTDTISAVYGHERYYGANIEKEMVGSSILATEHSIMTALTPTDGDRDEYDAFKYLITEVAPEGFISIVSDSYDFWRVIGETLPALKEEILNRNGRVVIRPDSGNPVDIICGTLETLIFDNEEHAKSRLIKRTLYLDASTNEYKVYDPKADLHLKYEASLEEKGLIHALWDIFEGTISEKGFKLLDSHIGAIYGDAITYDVAKEILFKLYKKGFASTNIVFGIGSYSFQGKTRDSLGMAIKATFAEINGEAVPLMKQPKTDLGKSSQRGKVAVTDNGESLTLIDGLYDLTEFEPINLLTPVFKDGELLKDHSLTDVRTKLWGDQ